LTHTPPTMPRVKSQQPCAAGAAPAVQRRPLWRPVGSPSCARAVPRQPCRPPWGVSPRVEVNRGGKASAAKSVSDGKGDAAPTSWSPATASLEMHAVPFEAGPKAHQRAVSAAEKQRHAAHCCPTGTASVLSPGQ